MRSDIESRASSSSEEHEQLRQRRVHLYPALVPTANPAYQIKINGINEINEINR
jgi:hypothetical protein